MPESSMPDPHAFILEWLESVERMAPDQVQLMVLGLVHSLIQHTNNEVAGQIINGADKRVLQALQLSRARG